MKAVIKPAPHKSEIAVDASFGNTQQFCGFFYRKPHEEAKFDHPTLALIQLLKFRQYSVQVDHLCLFRIDPSQAFVQGNRYSAITLLSSFRACMIDQNPPHDAGGKTVKVLAIFETKIALPNEFEKQLIHNASGLQEIFRTFPTKQGTCNASQLWIDELKKMVGGARFPVAPLAEKHRNFTRPGHADNVLLERSSVYL
jgi:hypothetical protein